MAAAASIVRQASRPRVPSQRSRALPPRDTPAAKRGAVGCRQARRASIQPISSASPEWYARGSLFGSPEQPRKWGTTPFQPVLSSRRMKLRA